MVEIHLNKLGVLVLHVLETIVGSLAGYFTCHT